MSDNQKSTFVEEIFEADETDVRRGLVYPQINSFEYFIKEKLFAICERLSITFDERDTHPVKRAKKSDVAAVVVNNKRILRIKNVEIQKYPTHPPLVDAHLFPKATQEARDGLKKLYPNESRSITNNTYDVPVYVDLVEVDENGDTIDVILKRHLFFRIPVMVGSCFSNNEKEEDYGGYFIINGTERVLVTQETFAMNKIIKYSEEEVEIHCKSGNVKYPIPVVTKLIVKNGIIYWKATSKLKESIPVPILMCAMMPHNNAIDPFVEFGHLGDFFTQSIYFVDAAGGFKWTRDDALLYIYSRLNMTLGLPKNIRIKEAHIYLMRNLLINSPDNKNELLLEMIRVLLHEPVDDMNHLKNKSYSTTSILLTTLLYDLITSVQYSIYNKLSEVPFDEVVMRHHIIQAFESCKNTITTGLVSAMGSGTWGAVSDSKEVPSGISQAVDRNSQISYLNLTRRISVSLKSVKMDARNVHGSFFGYLCVAETSEGEDVGLNKTLSIYAITSLERTLPPLGLSFDAGDAKVFINGDFVGFSPLSCAGFMRDFIFKRRSGEIPFDVSISFNISNKYVDIRANEGRLIRPLVIVEDAMNIDEVEYLDANEVEHAYIAMYPDDITHAHTHCELLPSVMFGMCANTIPFSNENQGPRITYYSAMAKQGIGLSILDDRARFTTNWQSTEINQRPLVTTNVLKNTRLNYYPNGIHLVCLIDIWGGFGQEDSFVVNQNMIDLNGIKTYAIHCYSHVLKRSNINPNTDIVKYPLIPLGDYIVDIGTKVLPGDCIINCEYRIPSKDLGGKVEGVRIVGIGEDEVEIHVKVRTEYEPEVGDKVSTRHAQKGVISSFEPPENMPWSLLEGCPVDIIKNPHSYPSRMTQGELHEMLIGKLICIKPPPGVFYDATAFNEHSCKVQDALHEFGVSSKYRYELVYDGTTGCLIPAVVEIGIIYVNILKHRVISKSYARATGPLDLITRQPPKGRSRLGGIRLGEMERDALIAAGAAESLQDRIDCCDPYEIKACPDCGRMDATNRTKGTGECYCGSEKSEVAIKTRYAFKSVLQQIQAMNINVSCFKE